MRRISAGLLVYRERGSTLEVFIVHNGGPFWAKKDKGVWSLPKGEIGKDEQPLVAAKREFEEETGFKAPKGPYFEIGEVDYPGGSKAVIAWAAEGNFDAEKLKSNKFTMKWPPGSNQEQQFPEVDKGGWFSLPDAAVKLFPANLPFLERLAAKLGKNFSASAEPPSQVPLL